jgi:4,4'-diaponeurosporenoate glycosyltransferase
VTGALGVDLALALLIIGAVVWAQRLVADLRTLPPADVPAGGTVPASVSVVVPARDEEQTLPALLRSVAEQLPEVHEVVVVDDASRDATAAVARADGARVVPAGTPPPGWTGKAWACHTGAASSTGGLLLFLDADTVLRPGALASLLAAHARHGGLVSVQPHHDVVRPYEQLSAYFNVVALMASEAFTRRRRVAASRAPMAFGPCLLTSRVDYARAGGHEAVRADILDDAALAAAYHRAGLPVWCAVGGDAVRMRSYPGGLGQLVAGWTKNIASGAADAAPGATAATVAWISAHHAVAVGAVLSLLVALAGWGGSLVAGSPLLWAVAYAAVALQLRWVLRRAGSFRWWAWALFPVPLLAFDLVFARSLALTVVRRSVPLRGRDVSLAGGRSGEEVA